MMGKWSEILSKCGNECKLAVAVRPSSWDYFYGIDSVKLFPCVFIGQSKDKRMVVVMVDLCNNKHVCPSFRVLK